MSAPIGSPPPRPARMIATLALAGILSGFTIVAAYRTTLPTITANQNRALRTAVLHVVPGSASLRRLVLQDGELIERPEGNEPEAVYAAYDEGGQLVGYALPAEGPGFQDTIRLIYGFDPAKRQVIGMEVLESRETPGLGDKIYKDPAFRASFGALAVEPEIVAVKKGERDDPNEIDAITGATISSKAVVKILNRSNRHWLPYLAAAEEGS